MREFRIAFANFLRAIADALEDCSDRIDAGEGRS